MTWVNVGCGPYRAPEPWVNLDVHVGDGVEPDIQVKDALFPLAEFDDDSIDRVYMGHVLEHIPWPECPRFLEDIYRAMKPGAELMAVGPDCFRVIQRWKDGLDPEGWPLVVSILENPWDRAYGEPGYGIIEATAQWPYARHWWNSDERRIQYLFEWMSPFEQVQTHAISEDELGAWPLVAYTQWQCAVSARKAG